MIQDERAAKLQRLGELETRVREQRAKIQLLADADPEVMQELGMMDDEGKALAGVFVDG